VKSMRPLSNVGQSTQALRDAAGQRCGNSGNPTAWSTGGSAGLKPIVGCELLELGGIVRVRPPDVRPDLETDALQLSLQSRIDCLGLFDLWSAPQRAHPI
jgi:hypothetical protein